jgi:hypothetical protein
MRKSILILSILALLLVCGCTHKEYDAPEGVNREMTLFGGEISIPVGNLGPITVKDLLKGNASIASLVDQMLQEASDGTLCVNAEETFFSKNAYELSFQIPDRTQPYSWQLGTVSSSITSPAAILGFLGLKFPEQTLAISMQNPLLESFTLNTTVRVDAGNYTTDQKLEDYEFKPSYSPRALVAFTLPEDKIDMIDRVMLVDTVLDLPANFTDVARSGERASFTFAYSYAAKIAPGPLFAFSTELPLNNLNLKIGQYRLHGATLSFELENSLPFDITIDKILVRDEKGTTNPDVVFSSGIKIAGGTLAKPGVTPVTLSIEATEGTIPDIQSLSIQFSIKCAEGAGGTPLSTRMGLSVKSASATLRGGITLFGHE